MDAFWWRKGCSSRNISCWCQIHNGEPRLHRGGEGGNVGVRGPLTVWRSNTHLKLVCVVSLSLLNLQQQRQNTYLCVGGDGCCFVRIDREMKQQQQQNPTIATIILFEDVYAIQFVTPMMPSHLLNICDGFYSGNGWGRHSSRCCLLVFNNKVVMVCNWNKPCRSRSGSMVRVLTLSEKLICAPCLCQLCNVCHSFVSQNLGVESWSQARLKFGPPPTWSNPGFAPGTFISATICCSESFTDCWLALREMSARDYECVLTSLVSKDALLMESCTTLCGPPNFMSNLLLCWYLWTFPPLNRVFSLADFYSLKPFFTCLREM